MRKDGANALWRVTILWCEWFVVRLKLQILILFDRFDKVPGLRTTLGEELWKSLVAFTELGGAIIGSAPFRGSPASISSMYADVGAQKRWRERNGDSLFYRRS